MNRIEAIQELINHARKTLNPSTAAPIIDALEHRKHFEQIKQEYRQLRREGMKSEDAKRQLMNKHCYSMSSIEAAIYKKG